MTASGLSWSVMAVALLATHTNVQAAAGSAVEVIYSVKRDTSPPLRQMRPIPVDNTFREANPLRLIHPEGTNAPIQNDTALQSRATAPNQLVIDHQFEAVGNGFVGPQGPYVVSVSPPDTNGDVGPNHYVQWVNLALAIFDKTGVPIFGPVNGNTLWSGFGGPCENSNSGDPIAQYDSIADRWVMSQFSVQSVPFYQCFAVSTSPDPLGSYHRYAFEFGPLPDYPKIAVWPDAYYASFNMFAGGFIGPAACAFDRAAMLNGDDATVQCVQLGATESTLLPADLDGSTQPPPQSPGFFMNIGQNQLKLWKFMVDWDNPANSDLSGPQSLATSAYNQACGGGACIPQSGTVQRLDSLADRLMYRLAYRNFGTHESLVVNHSVRAGNNSAGVRWYEVRNPAATPSIYQQGTFAPDSTYRWMGSVAMDGFGNLAMGYSASSRNMKPAIRITGRNATDSLGQLQAEATLFSGTGAQSGGLARWGDYSSISVDPDDDCTFWFTTEYLQTNGSYNWKTRVGIFRFPQCN